MVKPWHHYPGDLHFRTLGHPPFNLMFNLIWMVSNMSSMNYRQTLSMEKRYLLCLLEQNMLPNEESTGSLGWLNDWMNVFQLHLTKLEQRANFYFFFEFRCQEYLWLRVWHFHETFSTISFIGWNGINKWNPTIWTNWARKHEPGMISHRHDICV